MSVEKESFIVIGAGPVGVATSCLLKQLGQNVICYEARSRIFNDPLQTYPIGINPRALYCFGLISSDLEGSAKESGLLVG